MYVNRDLSGWCVQRVVSAVHAVTAAGGTKPISRVRDALRDDHGRRRLGLGGRPETTNSRAGRR